MSWGLWGLDKTASGEDFPGYTFHLVDMPYVGTTAAAAYPAGRFAPGEVVRPRDPGGESWHSAMDWERDNVISNIETKPQHRRKGLATALYRWVKDNHVPDLIHSPARKPDGQAWAASTGDDLEADLAEYKRRRGYTAAIDRDVAEDLVKLGMPAPMPDGITFHYHPTNDTIPVQAWAADPTIQATLFSAPAVEARHHGKTVGHLEWDPPLHATTVNGISYGDYPPEVSMIKVHRDYRRHGIGTALFDFARQHQGDLEHSDSRTALGEKWIGYEQSRTAAPRRRFTQDWQQVGFDLMPVDAVAHYMQRKETGFGDEKRELYELNKRPPLSEQIRQRGYEKPVHLVTDGRSGSIYDGHHRIDIARQLGHTHIPVEVSWRTPNPDGTPMFGDSQIEPWLKGWLTDMRQGRETVGRRTAAQDPQQIVDRLRSLNHRHRIHRSRYPAPDRVIAQNPPLSIDEEQERQQLNATTDDLHRRWNNMDPMDDHELALHKAFYPMEHRRDDIEAMTDAQKARHWADLANPLFYDDRTPREKHQHDRLKDWAEGHFGNMQNDAQDAVQKWDDYHRTGLHPTGLASLGDVEGAHHPDLTALWGAEMTRPTYDRTPIREKISNNTNHYRELLAVAHEHRAALDEMATHGPLHYSPDRLTNSYAYQHVEDTRNRLRIELQHKKAFAVPHISELSRVAHPGEAHAEGSLVNPRYRYGMAPQGSFQSFAEQQAYMINCQRSILATEARHKGYNVEAQRNYRPYDQIKDHPENDTRFDDHDIAGWFRNKDGSTPRWIDAEDVPGGEHLEPIPNPDNDQRHLWDHMHNQIADWGPHARGVICTTYKTAGGNIQRHVLSVKNDEHGIPQYYDSQTAEKNLAEHWRNKIDYDGSSQTNANNRYLAKEHDNPEIGTRWINKSWSPLRFMRLDDKDLSPKVSQHLVDRGTQPDSPVTPIEKTDKYF